ncbi:GNAT family N-acetyltransferase [Candidatus Falkowbacteria bacterium]|nr:GNAT family N-acetyltransferase [Candidatus Falkowbacteria bacterium]
MEQKLEILSLAGNQVDNTILDKCANLYCGIWREPPWNEDFWKPQEVKQDIIRDSAKEAGDCLIAVIGTDRVAGFTWGYMAPDNYLDEISGSDYFTSSGKFTETTFYVDELGVDAGCRGHGVGKRLTRALIDHAAISGARSLVLRTDEKAFAARALYAKLGFVEIPVRDAKYPTRTYWHLAI